jgi:hypothetical protein
MRSHAKNLGAALLAVSLLALGACSGGDTPENQQQSADEQQTGDSSAGSGSETAGAVQFDPEDVIVEQTYALGKSPEDSVTVGIQSLVVDGPVMTLTLVVTPDFTSVSNDAEVSLFDVNEETLFRPTLIDRGNLKEYSVIGTNEGRAWASDNVETRTQNGNPMRVFATFAAPEDEIDTIEVSVRNTWTPFTDVPIEQ